MLRGDFLEAEAVLGAIPPRYKTMLNAAEDRRIAPEQPRQKDQACATPVRGAKCRRQQSRGPRQERSG